MFAHQNIAYTSQNFPVAFVRIVRNESAEVPIPSGIAAAGIPCNSYISAYMHSFFRGSKTTTEGVSKSGNNLKTGCRNIKFVIFLIIFIFFCSKLYFFGFIFLFLRHLHAESGEKTAGKSRKEVSLRCLWDTIYGKGVYHALCS